MLPGLPGLDRPLASEEPQLAAEAGAGVTGEDHVINDAMSRRLQGKLAGRLAL